MLWKTILGIAGLLAALVGYLHVNVFLGARRRDSILRKQLEALEKTLESGLPVQYGEVERLAHARELRPMLYAILEDAGHLELFPHEYLSQIAQAESKLAYWLLHPNEQKRVPQKIELVKNAKRVCMERDADFYVFRYQMPDDHWEAGKWLLGISGPFFVDDVPYLNHASAFSRWDDAEDKTASDLLIDWYIIQRNKFLEK